MPGARARPYSTPTIAPAASLNSWRREQPSSSGTSDTARDFRPKTRTAPPSPTMAITPMIATGSGRFTGSPPLNISVRRPEILAPSGHELTWKLEYLNKHTRYSNLPGVESDGPRRVGVNPVV